MNPELEIPETRSLASFRTVDSIEPIEGADAIEIAVVGGWKVVTKKGEFQPGDPCVYFEIDSFMPDGVPAWQFLVDKQPKMQNDVRGHRLRTIKLRGQISQGLILPVGILPQTAYVLAIDEVALVMLAPQLTADELAEAENLRRGLDEHQLDPRDLNLNKLLNIVKWDPPLPASLSGMAEGLFPSFIQKTDQERAQNLKGEIFGYEDVVIPANEELGRPEIIRAAKGDRNARYEVTMKLDGSSATFFHRDGEIGVCSRNLQLKICEANAGNSFVRMLFDSGLNIVLPRLGNIAIQGELMGPGIQENREQLKDFKLFIFDVQLLDEGRFMTPIERKELMNRLIDLGVNPSKVTHAPFMEFDVTLEELGLTDMDRLLKAAEGPSLVHPIREGLVYKRMDGGFSFKTISNRYLEKEKG